MSNEDQASETAPAGPRTATAPITATQHTPWKQRRESRATGAGVVNTRGLPVCDVFGDSFEERESRSRLFAAAPELLEALDNAAATLDTLLAHYWKEMPPTDQVGRQRVPECPPNRHHQSHTSMSTITYES